MAIIGKVSVKVVPDTQDFRSDLTDDLNRLERIIGPLTIKAELNISELEDQANRAVDAAEKKVRNLKIATDLDYDGLQRTIKQVDAMIDKTRQLEIGFTSDRAGLEKLKGELEGLRELSQIELDVIPDASGLQQAKAQIEQALREKLSYPLVIDTDEGSLREAKDKIDDLIREEDGRQILLDLGISAGSIPLAAVRIARVARDRIVALMPVVDSKAMAAAEATLAALSGGRFLKSMVSDLWDMVKNLDKNIPLIGSFALAIMGMGASVLSATANLFGISKGLAQIGQAGLALPGILGGIAIGAGSLIAVLRDWNTVLPEVKNSMTSLQDSMSSTFWAKAKAPIHDMVYTLLPSLSAGFGGTADALGAWAASLANGLKASLGTGDALLPMFDNMNKSILISSTGTDEFANIIKVLGTRGSDYLPRLATWFNDITISFSGWLDKVEASGQLKAWIDEGISELNNLGSALHGAGSILAGVARAADAAGGTSLTMLAEKLNGIADIVNGPAFQTNMTQAFKAAGDAMDTIARVAGPSVENFFLRFTETLTDIMPLVGQSIGNLVKGIAQALTTEELNVGLEDFFKGINDFILAMQPAWDDIGSALGALLSLIGTFASRFGPIMATTFGLVADSAEKLAPSLDRIVTGLSGALLDALEVIGPLVVGFADALAFLLTPVLSSPGALYVLAGAFIAIKAAVAGNAVVTTLALMQTRLVAIDKVAPGAAVGITSAAKAMGLIGLAVMGVSAIDTFMHSLGGQVTEIDETTEALGDMALGVSGLDDVFSSFSMGLNNIDGMTGAIKRLVDPGMLQGFSDFMVKVTTFGLMGNVQTDKISGEFNAIGDSLASMVENGNVDLARDKFEKIRTEWEKGGGSIKELRELMPTYVESLVNLGKVTEAEADAAAKAAQATVDYAAALGTIGIKATDAFATINDGSKKFINLTKAMDGSNYSFESFRDNLIKQQDDMRAWSDNMVLLAKQGVSQGVLQELANMGPQGAQLVADMVGKTTEELSFMEEGFLLSTEGAVRAAGSGLAGLDAETQAAVAAYRAGLTGGLAAANPAVYEQAVLNAASLGSGLAAGVSSPQFLADVAALSAAAPTALAATPNPLFQPGLAHGLGYGNGLGAASPAVIAAAKAALPDAAVRSSFVQNALFPNGEAAGASYGKGITFTTEANKTATAAATAGAAKRGAFVDNILFPNGHDAGASFGKGVEATKAANEAAASAATVKASLSSIGDTKLLLHSLGQGAGNGFADGLRASAANIESAARLATRAAHDGADSVDLNNLGYYAGIGFARGLSSSTPAIRAAASSAARSAYNAMKAELDINSPSREMAKLGSYTGQGFANGIESQFSAIKRVASEASSIAQDALTGNTLDVSMNANMARNNMAASGNPASSSKTLNYYAAAGSSLGAEEDLFAATNRGRMVGF